MAATPVNSDSEMGRPYVGAAVKVFVVGEKTNFDRLHAAVPSDDYHRRVAFEFLEGRKGTLNPIFNRAAVEQRVGYFKFTPKGRDCFVTSIRSVVLLVSDADDF